MQWIGSAIVAVATLTTAIFVFILERRRKVKRLRAAYISELESMKLFTDQLNKKDVNARFFRAMSKAQKNTIYKSTAEDIGILSNIEVHTIVSYYSLLEYLEENVEEADDSEFEDSSFEEFLEVYGKGLEALRVGTIALLRNPPRWPNQYTSNWYPTDEFDAVSSDFVNKDIIDKMDKLDENSVIDKEAIEEMKKCARK